MVNDLKASTGNRSFSAPQVQSRCPTCNCLVPDLVFDEHRQTCWAKSDTKRVSWLFFFHLKTDFLFLTESGYTDGKQKEEVWRGCCKVLLCA